MDFLKNIAWWVWLIIAGLLGVVGYGIYYYRQQNSLAEVSEDVADGGANSPDEPEPSAGGNDAPSKPSATNGGGGFVDDVAANIDLKNSALPIGKRGVRAIKATDIADYTYVYTHKKPYQKSGQVQYLQQLLIGKKQLTVGSDDGILGLKTAQAVLRASKNKINLGSKPATLGNILVAFK